MYSDGVEVSNLPRQVIHTEGRRATSKARSARNNMRSLNPTVSVTAVTYPLTWDNAMEPVRGNDCVVDTSHNPRTRYPINDASVLAGRELKTAAMTNGISGSGGSPIPLMSGSTMGIEGQLTVYNHGGGCYQCLYPKPNPMGIRKEFFATDKGLLRKDGKVISAPVRTREE